MLITPIELAILGVNGSVYFNGRDLISLKSTTQPSDVNAQPLFVILFEVQSFSISVFQYFSICPQKRSFPYICKNLIYAKRRNP
jgi:hypothetical protein